MPLSGTVPRFDVSTTPEFTSPTVVSVSGAVSGTATGAQSTEALGEVFRRHIGLLAMSGTVSGANHQIVSGSTISGLRNLQQELALRVADIELGGGQANAVRLAHANAILTGSGEVLFGS
jgi:hypothetical protein